VKRVHVAFEERDRVPLLVRHIQVRPQHLVDHERVRIERGNARREFLPWLGPSQVHRLPHRPVHHSVLALQGPHGHAGSVVASDRRLQLDLRHLWHDKHLSQEHPHAAVANNRGAVT
jgi:hypothetical protein